MTFASALLSSPSPSPSPSHLSSSPSLLRSPITFLPLSLSSSSSSRSLRLVAARASSSPPDLDLGRRIDLEPLTTPVQDQDPSFLLDTTGGGGGDPFDGSGNNGGNGGNGDGDGEEEEDFDFEGSKKNNKNKKKKMLMSQKFTLIYAALVGVGGFMGFIKSGSIKSAAAGGISSLLLGFVYTQLPTNPTFASSLGLGISGALLTVMGSRFKNSGKIFPAGVVALLSLFMTGGYLHGLLRGH